MHMVVSWKGRAMRVHVTWHGEPCIHDRYANGYSRCEKVTATSESCASTRSQERVKLARKHSVVTCQVPPGMQACVRSEKTQSKADQVQNEENALPKALK